MKICHVSSCFPPSYGGVETYVHNVCKRLSKRGFNVKVITSSRGMPPAKYHEWMDNIEIIRYAERLHIFEAPILFRAFFNVLADDYDVLHVHGMTPTFTDITLLIGKIFRHKPVLLTYHFDPQTWMNSSLGRVVNSLYAAVARRIVRLADRIVVTSKPYAETSPVLEGISSNVIIIPCGTDLNRFRVNERDSESGKTGKLNKEHQILYVGKLSWYKGVEHLIKAMEILIKKIENVHLTIIGEGPQKDMLSSLANELGLRDYITFMGSISNESLVEFYQMADILVLPSTSRREAFGIVLLEAMACGKTVVVSDIPGPNSVVKDGKSGVLVPPRDPMCLANALLDLLLDDEKRERMGSYARHSVEKNNDWDSLVLQYEAIYHEIGKR